MKKPDHKPVIRITTGNTSFTATMYDNAAANDFLTLLPLTLKLTDYASTEKVSDLPRRLNTAGAPAGYKPSIGDITYYAPWGNIAIFYKGFSYAGGLVPLGRIEKSIEVLKHSGSISVTMELISQP